MDDIEKKITINDFDKFPKCDNHVYVYLRVSTDKQDISSQLNEVYNYCDNERLYPPSKNIVLDEGVSGKIDWKDRKLNNIVEDSKKNDIIIVPEISRLGRNMNEVNEIIGICGRKKVMIIDIKNKLKLDGSFQTSIMANLYTIFSQMERQLISERTKQGLQIAKQKGNLNGRKRGIKKNRLDDKDEEIKKMIDKKISIRQIAKELNVKHPQLIKYIKAKI
jgi:putative DNA-invertase from lambdoid prophage Rac